MIDMRMASFSHGRLIKLICMVLPMLWLAPALAGAASTEDEIAALKAQKNNAIFKVQDIVNQPVTHLKRTPEMVGVAEYDFWFHPGAITPDFDHVDVRTTQNLQYQSYQYVTSPQNPGEVFLGSELEFNAQTKYFYTDRSLPKKKLTEAEMEEINQLYRIIGHCNDQLYALENPDPPLTQVSQWIAAHKPVVAAAVGVLLLILVVIRKRRAPEFEN
jgi:hypothetical protein